MVVKDLSCNLNLGAQFNYQTGFVLQKVIQSQSGRKINCSELDGVMIRLQFQDVSNKTLRRTIKDPEFLKRLKQELLHQKRGVEKVPPHTLQLAHVVQEKPKLRTIKRKLTPLEPQGQVDQEVEKLIDQARLTTAAHFYKKD